MFRYVASPLPILVEHLHQAGICWWRNICRAEAETLSGPSNPVFVTSTELKQALAPCIGQLEVVEEFAESSTSPMAVERLRAFMGAPYNIG